MDNIKNDEYYLNKIRYCFERIKTAMKDISYENYCEDVCLQESTMFNLIQLSEYSRKLSDEYRNRNAKIPWTDIYGLRNRIVHDYGNVALTVVYSTLIDDIPDLYKMIFDDHGA